MKNKKAFIASALLDLISWILFLLVAILFYFVFKFSAQQSTITISDYISLDEFYPSLYLLHSTYNNEIPMTEFIINAYNEGSLSNLGTVIKERYYFTYDQNYPF